MKDTDAAALIGAGGAVGGSAGVALKKRKRLSAWWKRVRHGKKAHAHAAKLAEKHKWSEERTKREAAGLIRRGMK